MSLLTYSYICELHDGRKFKCENEPFIVFLRAKRASNLQGASFFLECIKKMFPLEYLGITLIGQWIQRFYWPVARVCNVSVWETLI